MESTDKSCVSKRNKAKIVSVSRSSTVKKQNPPEHTGQILSSFSLQKILKEL